MGRDPGRAVLRHCRALALGAALGTALAAGTVWGAPAATADDATPGAEPTQFSTPSLSPPSQQQVEDARQALDRLRGRTRPATPAALTDVAGPVTGRDRGSASPRISDEAWWTIGAGALVLLVASETTRISVRKAKHRKSA
jgi:hypothetical protein